MLRPPAGDVSVRFDGELTAISANPEWGPPFEFVQLGSPAEVDALHGAPEGYGLVGAWAWLDQDAGLIRERVFVPEAGVDEDEATGSAALRLCALLGRAIEIRQGHGSVLFAEPVDAETAEVSGRVAFEEVRDRARRRVLRDRRGAADVGVDPARAPAEDRAPRRRGRPCGRGRSRRAPRAARSRRWRRR